MLIDSIYLYPDEYFFLASNTFNKEHIIREKIPMLGLTIEKDIKTGTYLLEQGLSAKPDFDVKLEKIMENIPMTNIFYDYTYVPDVYIREKNILAKKKALKMLETHSYKQFVTALKDPKLIKSLKSVLSNSKITLNKTKINSQNFSYLNFRSSTGFVNGITEVIKKPAFNPTESYNKEEKFLLTTKHQFKSSRPQTSRTMPIRPISSSMRTISNRTRPQTGISRIKKNSTALSLGIKDEPYHVLTLRESVTLRNIDN